MPKIIFRGFPNTKAAEKLQAVLQEAYDRLQIKKFDVIMMPLRYKKPPLPCNFMIEYSKKHKNTFEVTCGEKMSTKRLFLRKLIRGSIHELCHIKVADLFGSLTLSQGYINYTKRKSTDVNAITFIDGVSPQCFIEFIADTIYMEHFPEYRYMFARETKELISRAFCDSYDRLVENKYEQNICKLLDLFYVWRVVFLLRKYNEKRRSYKEMLLKLKNKQEYKFVFDKLDKIFENWAIPKKREVLFKKISCVLKLSNSLDMEQYK